MCWFLGATLLLRGPVVLLFKLLQGDCHVSYILHAVVRQIHDRPFSRIPVPLTTSERPPDSKRLGDKVKGGDHDKEGQEQRAAFHQALDCDISIWLRSFSWYATSATQRPRAVRNVAMSARK
jgi:hypothetical protein